MVRLKWLARRLVYLKRLFLELGDRLLYQPHARSLRHPWHGGTCSREIPRFYTLLGRVLWGLGAFMKLPSVKKEVLIEGFETPSKECPTRSLLSYSPFCTSALHTPKEQERWAEALSDAYALAMAQSGSHLRTHEWHRAAGEITDAFVNGAGRVDPKRLSRFRADGDLYRRLFNDQFSYVDPQKGYTKNYLDAIDLILHYHRIASVVDPALLASVSESGAGSSLCVRYRSQRLSEKLLYHTVVADDILRSMREGYNVVVDIGASYGGVDRILKLYRQESCFVLVELPETLILSGWYLFESFPDAKIALYGDWRDAKDRSKLLETYDFILIPPHALTQLPDASVDWVLNTASMGFMEQENIAFYLEQIGRLLKIGGYFYSLNKPHTDHWGIGTNEWHFSERYLARSLRCDNRFTYPQWLAQKIAPRLGGITIDRKEPS